MLQIGYLLHVICMPKDLQAALQDTASPLFMTAQVYQMLVDSRLLWKVWYIDEHDNIWVEVQFMNDDGEPEFHTIVVDEGTFEKIECDDYVVLDRLM
ncbi:hypothetical protein [Pseudoalteromonas xiamenensis]|uniref:Uncharacterized protein n=1 Tax=Pseudoalteromonas xiamenensis TaxID=882626 RepID=A0A975DMV3_9GAMM|nr:hypothetical protein [Pseudoalteromonas xiamenensis]QTH73326.1 hypothetical protein J5O05_21405 [Pseudoalteromonas xiamenensis]